MKKKKTLEMQVSSKLAVRGRLVDPPLLIFQFSNLGPVVRRPISTNPGLNFNPGLFSFHQKYFLGQFSLFFLE